VTRVRITRGARIVGKDSVSIRVYTKLGADLVAIRGPLAIVRVNRSITNTTSNAYLFKDVLDFVYIYRLYEVYYRKEVYLKLYSYGEIFRLKDYDREYEDSKIVDNNNIDDNDIEDVVEED
jgi:hypothetical protein